MAVLEIKNAAYKRAYYLKNRESISAKSKKYYLEKIKKKYVVIKVPLKKMSKRTRRGLFHNPISEAKIKCIKCEGLASRYYMAKPFCADCNPKSKGRWKE